MSDKYWTPEQKEVADLDAVWGDAANAAAKAVAEGKPLKPKLDAIVDLYCEAGAVAWPEQKERKGKARVRAAWKKALQDYKGLALKFTPVDIVIGGDLAVDFGKVRFGQVIRGKRVVENDKYLVVWKMEGGGWKVLYDSWNTNKPAQPAKKKPAKADEKVR
jgi:ketosteroid isomerase-like protein